MTTMVQRLASVAHAAGGAVEPAVLQVRTLANLAAAVGEASTLTTLAAPLGPPLSLPDLAHRISIAMHARTQDDFFPPGRSHLGAVVLPAALAVGAPDLHAALAAGYEVTARVSEAYSRQAQLRGWRPTGVFGPLGAAAAASVGLGLDVDRTAHAIALASTACGGTNQSWLDGTDEWLLEVAAASRVGVEAAQLAAGGVDGSARALEGAKGWSAAVFDDPGAEPLRLVLEDDRIRTSEVGVKRYPISGIAQAPTAAACAIGGGGADITAVEVMMNPDEISYPGTDHRGPFRGRGDALMSVPLCVALGLVYGTIGYRFPDPLDPEVERLVDVIVLTADATLAETDAVVRITRDGVPTETRTAGADLLFPGWDELADARSLAAQFETDLAVATELIAAVASDTSAHKLVDILNSAVGSGGTLGELVPKPTP